MREIRNSDPFSSQEFISLKPLALSSRTYNNLHRS
jgi:hypothetical protein